MFNLFLADDEIQSYACCSKHVVYVIRTNQMARNFMTRRCTPFEVQIRVALGYLTRHAKPICRLCAIFNKVQTSGNALEVWVVVIDENLGALLRAKEIVEFAFGFYYALETAKPENVSLAYIGDNATILTRVFISPG